MKKNASEAQIPIESYQKAREELDALVAEIEQPQTDLGQITDKIKRATLLVTYCRNYLRTLQEETDKMLSENGNA